MKIAVFSDSHGIIQKMLDACREHAPDMIVHLGDYARDSQWLHNEFPKTPLKSVKGNCDYASPARDADTFFSDNLKIFICHGHFYKVKQGYNDLAMAAGLMGADIAMFGHTHKPHVTVINGVTLINPGSAGESGATFALLDTQDREVKILSI